MRDVIQAIHRTATTDPARVAITGAGGPMSYGELARAIDRVRVVLAGSPDVVGLLMTRSSAAIVADLALASLGRTIVPLPDFFSPGQWQHMIQDAGVGAVVSEAALAGRLADLPVPILLADASVAEIPHTSVDAPRLSRRIIYTSGTTGKPKGVVLTETALMAGLTGMEKAVRASSNDVHLSVLPFSLLLEQLAGILLPLKVGARIHIAASPTAFVLEADSVQPTTTILVPDLLAGWVGYLRQTGKKAPASLRFVAAGGAPVGDKLADAAWAAGIPVHEGYGLSECGSVVAVNRPGARCAGTVGRPLDGVAVTIENNEIVVRGPSVMRGYLGGEPAGGVWRTGDAGEWDDEGNLIVLGRKDDIVVTQAGRNVHPEWIEPMLLADPDVQRAAIVAGRSGIKAVLVATPGTTDEWLSRIEHLTAGVPAYARPTEVALLSPDEAQSHDLFTLDGRPRRRRIAQHLSETSMTFFETLEKSTALDREAFQSIALIRDAVANGVDRPLYLSFLNSAYHHVRYTVPLLQAALAACGPDDAVLAAGLEDYIREEVGHDEWILEDITALGGNGEKSRHARPPLAVRAMVAYAFHLIAEEGPYALLGMVHVLEGMSVALALKAAKSIHARVAPEGSGGFSYLTSHGALDVEHVDSFEKLLDAVDTPERRAVVIASAKDFYRLYGDVFRELDSSRTEASHAA